MQPKVHAMRTLIVYASWFGHNRSIASISADRLSSHASRVICAPVAAVTAGDTIGCDLLALRSFTRVYHASRRMRHLVKTILERRFSGSDLWRPNRGRTTIWSLAKRCVRPPPLRVILLAPDIVS